MRLTDLNSEVNMTGGDFVKLADYPDYTEITVVGAGVKTGGKYGDSPYFIAENGDYIFLPKRYITTINRILSDEDMETELLAGQTHIIKHSKDLKNGMTTPTFEFI